MNKSLKESLEKFNEERKEIEEILNKIIEDDKLASLEPNAYEIWHTLRQKYKPETIVEALKKHKIAFTLSDFNRLSPYDRACIDNLNKVINPKIEIISEKSPIKENSAKKIPYVGRTVDPATYADLNREGPEEDR